MVGGKGLVHIVDDTLGDHRRSALQRRDLRHGAVVMIRHLVQAGDVDARQLGRRTEKLHLAPALPAGLAVQLHQLHGDVLPLPQTHQIDEVVIGSPDSRANRGIPARRSSSSMSPQGAKTRWHHTPSMLFMTP